ncbi:MAG: hypothetical protein RLZZ479_696 [Bacteroidota bacterium]|jgi:hypothetical protein
MYNRKERRKIDKQLGINKLLKIAPKELKEKLLQKRKEESLAIQKDRKENLEAIAIENEIQLYTKRLQFYIEKMGYTQEKAEQILLNEKLKDEEREARKKKNK